MNVYKEFERLMAPGPLQVATVLSVDAAGVLAELPGGAILRARGEAAVGARVFVRDGVIEGPAPSLPHSEITV